MSKLIIGLEKIKGIPHWVDVNDNAWSCSVFNKEAAEVQASTMSGVCTKCINCTACQDCTHCVDCTMCIKCQRCAQCLQCSSCSDCKMSTLLANCVCCNGCNRSNGCTDCDNCVDCSFCRESKNCTQCTGCKTCFECTKCVDCTDCQNTATSVHCMNITTTGTPYTYSFDFSNARSLRGIQAVNVRLSDSSHIVVDSYGNIEHSPVLPGRSAPRKETALVHAFVGAFSKLTASK